MKRTITIDLDEMKPEHQSAIGYFSYWAYESFDIVNIYGDGGNDLIAHFKQSNGDRVYTIGAIWNHTDKKYSFHS